MFPGPLSCDDFIGVNSAKSSPPYEQTQYSIVTGLVFARFSVGEGKGRGGTENATPKITKDSHLLPEQSGKLWLSHRFYHMASCKLKASITFDEEYSVNKTNKVLVLMYTNVEEEQVRRYL